MTLDSFKDEKLYYHVVGMEDGRMRQSTVWVVWYAILVDLSLLELQSWSLAIGQICHLWPYCIKDEKST